MATWWICALGATLALYLTLVAAFLVAGRRDDARTAARFVPDCIVLFTRLTRDPRLPARAKILLALLLPISSCRST